MTYREVQFEMKDSGVEWIAQIPKNWQVKRLKNLFSFGKGLPITKADLVENGVAVISYGQIHAKSNTGTHLSKELLRFIPEIFLETNPSSLISKHDIIFADTSEDLDGLGNAVLMDIDGKVFAGYHTIILHPIDTRFSKYLVYLFLTDAWRSQLRASASGIKVFSVTQKMLRSCNVILPSPKECDIITSFLDTQCIKIDSIISEAKASIEEYKSWKTSIIYEAVTKGLDPNVEMKDSGVEWIGKIPSNWTTKSIKYIMQESKERTATGTEEMLSVTQKYGIIKSSDATISNPSTSTEDWRIVHIGDIVFNKYKAHSGVFFVSPLEGIVTFNYCVYRCFPDNCAKYFEYQFKTPRCIGEFITHMKGVGDSISPLYTTELYKIKVIVPPLEEQLRIVEYLNIQCPRIDEIISEKESLVADLESYKKSLIFEVVTGKRRVV